MRKTKRYTKKNKRRQTRRRLNRRKMKGGSFLPFSDIKSAFDTIGYGMSKMVDTVTVPPSVVAPQKVGGDNPLPFKQPGHTVDINDFSHKV
jgi:hypothetical protein